MRALLKVFVASSVLLATAHAQIQGGGGGAGGSSGGGAVYGPTAAGSAAANPPVLMGGTAAGTSTGNVVNAAVKPASTAAAATDTALVVQNAYEAALLGTVGSSASCSAGSSSTLIECLYAWYLAATAPLTLQSSHGVNIGGVEGLGSVGSSLPTYPVMQGINTGNVIAEPHVCGTATHVHITSATDTQILAANGSENIYICDFEGSAGGAANFYFEKSSTGTCGSPTQIGQTWYVDAVGWGKAAGNAYYRGFNTGASQQLCVNTSNFTGPLDLTVYTDQY